MTLPRISNVPQYVTTEATSVAGAIVTYAILAATDNVDDTVQCNLQKYMFHLTFVLSLP